MLILAKNYEHLFKANSLPDPSAASATPNAAAGARKTAPSRFHSHYIQSKVVRARERIEAELKIAQEAENEQSLDPAAKASDIPLPDAKGPPPPPS